MNFNAPRDQRISSNHLFRFSVIITTLLLAAQFAAPQNPVPTVTGNARVDSLLSQMTLEEKISLIHGAAEDPVVFQGQAGYVPEIQRLHIPSLRLADGPPGVLTRIPSIAPTATMGLAATFSREDARANGELIAREAKSHGIDVVLQPFINIDRDLTYERGYNTFGEDPFLTGQIGAAEIRGIQSQGIMSQAKHYVAYDSNNENIFVDPQTLHEIYVAPFADAVAAGVSSIMCSYNKVNGEYACGNATTLNKILKEEIGFNGFVTSDWGATHGTSFINNGLDMEMPGPLPYSWTPPSYFVSNPPFQAPNSEIDLLQPNVLPGPRGGNFPEEPPRIEEDFPRELRPTSNLKTALASGAVTEATITRAAGRVLFQMANFGLLDGKSHHEITASPIELNARTVQRTSEDAAVLLKNEGEILPLKDGDLASLALIGPGAGQTIAVGMTGEKAVGLPERKIGTVETLREATDGQHKVHIAYAVANDLTGTPIPVDLLSHGGQPGLVRTTHPSGATQVDAQINFTDKHALPTDASYIWEGTLTIPASGVYRLHLQALGAFASLVLDRRRVAEHGRMDIHGDVTQAGQDDILPTTDGLNSLRVELDLEAGPHKLSLAVSPDSSNNPVQIRLNWVTPEQRRVNYERAISAAKRAKTAIVFVWSRGRPEFGLPGDQDKLIEDVAAVNSNLIVVLNVSQPVAMPWLSKAKAVLQMWWPGDEGGWSTAKVLLGKVNPAGRLPFTWPRRLDDLPVHDPQHPERLGREGDQKTEYSEGIFVGYRWFDKQKIEPLFPFGYGLSYSHFQYSGLKVVRTGDGGLDVSFEVTNLGARASDEVPQVYLGSPGDAPPGVQFAARTLIAFDRVRIDPKQTRIIRLLVPLRRLQYWSTSDERWITAAGSRTVFVGASSRDLRMEASVGITE